MTATVGSGPWLADKSALSRIDLTPDQSLWKERIERGLVRIASVTMLEIGYSARSAADLEQERTAFPMSLMPVEYATPQAEDRAMAVQRLAAARGYHRALSVPDLLIAALAEVGRLTVLHVDKDFELIAELTGQPVERLALP